MQRVSQKRSRDGWPQYASEPFDVGHIFKLADHCVDMAWHASHKDGVCIVKHEVDVWEDLTMTSDQRAEILNEYPEIGDPLQIASEDEVEEEKVYVPGWMLLPSLQYHLLSKINLHVLQYRMERNGRRQYIDGKHQKIAHDFYHPTRLCYEYMIQIMDIKEANDCLSLQFEIKFKFDRSCFFGGDYCEIAETLPLMKGQKHCNYVSCNKHHFKGCDIHTACPECAKKK